MASAVLFSLAVSCVRRLATRVGDQVKFRCASVFLWPQEEPISALPPDAEVRGRVVGFSDSGLEHRVFAMVEVVKTQIVIVRVSELDVIETEKHKE
jgi:hypothetical protein